jgi:transposase
MDASEPRERGRRKKSRRQVGGQPGHRGAHRPLVPIAKVDEIRPILPELCQHCGHSLPAQIEQVRTSGEPQRHQVTELPPIQAHTIEYQCHRVICPECGESTRAVVPEEATGHFGPQRTLLIAYLTVVCRMPRLWWKRSWRFWESHQFGEHPEMLGRSQPGGGRPRAGN